MFGGHPPTSHTDNGITHIPHRSQSSPASSDFGEFHSASIDQSPTSSRSYRPQQQTVPNTESLDDTDLLGSFEELDMEPPRSAPPLSLHQGLDLFADDDAVPMGTPPPHAPLRRLTSRSSISGSPTKSKYMWSSDFPGPSSPPRVTDAHILIQAPQQHNDDAASEFRRIRRQSDQHNASGKMPPPRMPRSATHSPTRSSIADAFATSRLATKWKRSVLGNTTFGGEDGPTKTALPIDISHKSPFASANQVAGSYIAPTGAPGFAPTGTGHAEEEDEFSNTRLLGRQEMTEPVLQVPQAKELRAQLPPRQRLADSWNLLFSLDQHGASLSTLYRQTERYAEQHRTGGNLLVVRDSNGHIFGVFLNEPIMRREGTYYGSGESFMFKFEPGQSKPRIYRWTGRNQYIALCESGFISFGGGGNSYGLILDATFSRNSSSTSPAFDNDILCNEGSIRSEKGEPFDCIGLEVWGTA